MTLPTLVPPYADTQDVLDAERRRLHAEIEASQAGPVDRGSIPAICIGCGKHPDQIDEYVDMARDEGMMPDEFIRREEGSYNPANGHFLCTPCYIEAGMPSSPSGWVAP